MKILNAKGLQRFASSGGFPDKEGYLLKRGDLNKGFQKRWFLLRGNLLFYSEKRGDKEPAGVIILEGCSIEIADCEQVDNYAFQITFPGSATRNYVLSASSQEDLESWMKALSCASYDYVRLLVAELENQLQEAVAADNAKLIQDAERDSRLFSHTYSIDAGATAGHDQRTHPPAGVDRKIPSGEGTDLMSDRLDDHFSAELFNSSGDGTSGVSMSFNIITWQTLGISNFYEMHDEIKRQIREFSPSHDQ